VSLRKLHIANWSNPFFAAQLMGLTYFDFKIEEAIKKR